MPLYMDVHTIDGGVSAADVEKAHLADLAEQGKHDVRYLRYWVDEPNGQGVLPGRGAVRGRPPRPCTGTRTAWSPTTSSRSRRGCEDRGAGRPARRSGWPGWRRWVSSRR